MRNPFKRKTPEPSPTSVKPFSQMIQESGEDLPPLPSPPAARLLKEGAPCEPPPVNKESSPLYGLDPDLYDLHERTMKHIFSPDQAEELNKRIVNDPIRNFGINMGKVGKHKYNIKNKKKMKKSKKESNVENVGVSTENIPRLERTKELMKRMTPVSNRMRNDSGLTFTDISSEKKREYTFPNGKKFKINGPLLLNVSESGSHRIFTDDETCYYVQPKEGWVIKWKSKKGKPHFVK